MNNQIKYGIVGTIIGGITVWLLMTAILNNNNIGMMNFRPSSQNGTGITGNIDRHFIEQMIPHHEDAITMSKLAQTKAQRTEIKQLANSIIDSQSKEINQMRQWYEDWYGKEVPTGNQVMSQHGMMGSSSSTHMGMMGDETDVTRLEQATDFDKTFAEEMIPHHQMAAMMANMLRNSTNRPEMKKLADDIITVQTKETNQMREWLSEWEN